MLLYFKNRDQFYNSKLWADIKKDLWNKRKNDEGQVICQYCGKPIVGRHNARLHHIQELTNQNLNDTNISTNYDNLVWFHFLCHNKHHKVFSKFERKVYLVVGSPCSGKSSFVESVATKDDLVLDVDKLWQAISINPIHEKNNRLLPIAMALRNEMLKQIAMRSGSWVNCFVTTTEPLPTNRKDMCMQLGVSEIITMDCTESEALKRLYENPNGRDIQLYEKLIHKFYSRYSDDEYE